MTSRAHCACGVLIRHHKSKQCLTCYNAARARRTCATEGCMRKLDTYNKSGRCGWHQKKTRAPCKADGCTETVRYDSKTGMCRAHYLTSAAVREHCWRAHNSPLLTLPEHLHDDYRAVRRRKGYLAHEAAQIIREGAGLT